MSHIELVLPNNVNSVCTLHTSLVKRPTGVSVFEQQWLYVVRGIGTQECDAREKMVHPVFQWFNI